MWVLRLELHLVAEFWTPVLSGEEHGAGAGGALVDGADQRLVRIDDGNTLHVVAVQTRQNWNRNHCSKSWR